MCLISYRTNLFDTANLHWWHIYSDDIILEFGREYFTWTHKSDRIYTKTTRLQDIATGCSGKRSNFMPNSFMKGGKETQQTHLARRPLATKVPRGSYTSLNTIISEAIHVENMQHTCTSTREHVYKHRLPTKIFWWSPLSISPFYTSLQSYIPRESLTVGELILAVLKSLRNSDMLIFPSLSISASSRSGSMEPLKPVCCKRIVSCKLMPNINVVILSGITLKGDEACNFLS